MKKVIFTSTFLLMITLSLHAQEVLTVGLGDEFYYGSYRNKVSEIEDFYQSIQQHGINISWGAAPPYWETGTLENPEALKFYKNVADIIHKNGIGVALGIKPRALYPKPSAEQWNAYQLAPETGLREIVKESWDLCNPEAFSELYKRYEKIMESLKPCELYYIDETILGAAPGENAYRMRISAYWTSPTYSTIALENFRKYLQTNSYPNADTAKFPVTTVKVAPSSKADMGLPAIPINEKNSDFLVADNDWPESHLWKLWYDWREEILTKLYSSEIELAEKIFSNNPNWQGTMASAPTFWFCRETGANPDKIAGIPKLKYLVAGYMNGHNLLKLKPSTGKYGKKLGGMIELTRHGRIESQDTAATFESFKNQINNGAELILFYPLANMNKHRNSEEQNKIGMNYRPSCEELWGKCAKYLEDKNLQVKLKPFNLNEENTSQFPLKGVFNWFF